MCPHRIRLLYSKECLFIQLSGRPEKGDIFTQIGVAWQLHQLSILVNQLWMELLGSKDWANSHIYRRSGAKASLRYDLNRINASGIYKIIDSRIWKGPKMLFNISAMLSVTSLLSCGPTAAWTSARFSWTIKLKTFFKQCISILEFKQMVRFPNNNNVYISTFFVLWFFFLRTHILFTMKKTLTVLSHLWIVFTHKNSF